MKNLLKGKKKLASLLIVGAVGATIAIATGFTSPSGTVHYNLTDNVSVKDIPAEFKKDSNLTSNLDKFNYNLNNSSLDVNLQMDVSPIPNDPENKLQAAGKGVVHVDGATHPFQIVESGSVLHQTKLSNGQTFIWGPINGKITTNKGEEDIAIGVSYIPETNQHFITATVGTMEKGLAAFAFGTKFYNDEITQILMQK